MRRGSRRSRRAGGSCRARAGRGGRAGCRPRRATRRRRARRSGRGGCRARSRSGRTCGPGRAAASAAWSAEARSATASPSTKSISDRLRFAAVGATASAARRRSAARPRSGSPAARSSRGSSPGAETARSGSSQSSKVDCRKRARELVPDPSPEGARGRATGGSGGTAGDHTYARSERPLGGHPANRGKKELRRPL